MTQERARELENPRTRRNIARELGRGSNRRRLHRASLGLRRAAEADAATGDAFGFMQWRAKRCGERGALRSILRAALGLGPWPLGACPAATVGVPGTEDAYWSPAPDGEWLDIVCVFIGTGNSSACDVRCIEMVAFNPSAPERWWRRAGMLELLGETQFECARSGGAPVRIFRTPLAWWEGGRDGLEADHDGGWRICPLGLYGAAMREVLTAGVALVCEDEEHALELDGLRRRLRRAEMERLWPPPRFDFVVRE